MASSLPCLQSFVEFVPSCLASAGLTEALAVLKHWADETAHAAAHDRLVLVNEQHHAVGYVSAQRLLHYLVTSGRLDQLPIVQAVAPAEYSARAVALPLLNVTPSIIEPLVVLAADLAIEAFLPQLQHQPHACYALANADGRFLGLLDSSRLLHFLAAHSTPLGASVHSAPEATAPPPSCLLPVNPLLHELLEHLPLPVMLQTRGGQVLAQNSIWRSQIHELLDPTCLRQEVATLLEMPLAETSMVGAPSTPRRLWSSLKASSSSSTQEDDWGAGAHAPRSDLKAHVGAVKTEAAYSDDNPSADSLGTSPSSSFGGSSCQLGSKPGTCICVCPLKDGQERILQFVRIPLSKLSSHSAFDFGNRTQTVETDGKTRFTQKPASSSPFFQLTSLLSTLHDDVPTGQALKEPYGFDAGSNRERSDCDPGAAPASADSASTSEELWLILAQDITEQQQLARELTAKNADLIQLNRLKDEFLACISHELRTPLTAVLGLSSLLKDQTLGALNQRQIHYAQLIYQSGRHLMAVVNDILDLTRMETGQLALVLEPVDLETVCQRAFVQAQQQQLQESQPGTELESHQPTFSLTLEPGLGLVMADEQRLRQMLAHLISNAIKFTEPNHPIGLKVGYWGGWIALTVWDTGIGIPAEKQHLIFQKFQQLENPLTRRFEGTGLGLVLTQRLARLHGGDVTFISKEGEGSQFTILLPPNLPNGPSVPKGIVEASPYEEVTKSIEAARSVQARSSAAIVDHSLSLPASEYALDISASQRSQLVLIVEAVPQSIEMLSDELTGLGYRVVIARSGTEALEKARRLQPCIIFLNPVLPLLSGWDVLTLLKSSLETQQIPVVMMTTKVDEEQAQQRQADHLLSLPIQPKPLQKCLQQLVVDRQKAAQHPRAAVLTVLRLSPGVWASQHQPILAADLDALLHSCQHRILEADDLEQAELLARVWKPNVVLLDGVLADAAAYFRLYCQHIFLASLPLVTIDQATSQAANQAKGLLVFPCLSASSLSMPEPKMEIATLLQVIQIAAGYAWRPLVLALDALTLPMSLETSTPPDAIARVLDSFPMETEWLQALIQYLHAADLRGSVGRCWQEVFQQLESHSVDVLLLCWTDASAQPFTTPMLAALQSLHKRPPILVLDHRQHYRTPDAEPIAPLPDVLQQIATAVLPAPLPMTELLHQIQLAMKVSNH